MVPLAQIIYTQMTARENKKMKKEKENTVMESTIGVSIILSLPVSPKKRSGALGPRTILNHNRPK